MSQNCKKKTWKIFTDIIKFSHNSMDLNLNSDDDEIFTNKNKNLNSILYHRK